STYQYLPPGTLGHRRKSDANRGWGAPAGQAGFNAPQLSTLVFLLPYMEQNNIYAQLNPQPAAEMNMPGWYQNSTYFAMAQVRVKSFLCPSDNDTEPTANGTFIALYCDANTLTLTGGYYPNPTGALFARSNYAPTAGSIGAPGVNFYG